MNTPHPDNHAEAAAPIDTMEQLFTSHGWSFERNGDEEIAASVRGTWSEFEVRALWQEQDRVMQLLVQTGINSTAGHGDPAAKANLFEVLSMINEQLWIGHFELWSADGAILFRHGTLLEGPEEPVLGYHQAHVMVEAALDECERYFPVFQFVLWGGKSPREAMAAAMIETEGEA